MRRLLVVIAAGLAGCYHPNIKDGTIYCSSDPTPKCPSGFTCAADGLCYKMPPMISSTVYGDGHLGKQDLTGMTGVLVLHTNTGEITLHDDSTGNDTPVVPAASGPYGTAQTAGPPVALWSFTELTIPTGMHVQVSSDSLALPVLAATTSLTMSGVIDLRGSGGRNGAAEASGVNPYGMSGADGAGGGGAMASSSGGGGGGHAVAGGVGLGVGGGAAGPAYGVGSVLPVFLGAGGGGGSDAGSSDASGFGGTGGGAIVLLGATVDIEGSIDVGGADGFAASAGDAGGGGGGSGGSILVSGSTVTVGANATLTATGGRGGAAAGSGGNGGDGAVGVIELDGNVTNGGTSMPMASIGTTALSAFPQ